jgi:hypothetical protein
LDEYLAKANLFIQIFDPFEGFGALVTEILGLVILACIIGLIVLGAIEIDNRRARSSSRPSFNSKRTPPPPVHIPAPEIQLAICPVCEATILAEALVCPHCGHSRPICMVCHLPLQFDDDVLLCPHCKGQAHRIHILEYLKVKGKCPNCQADLDEHELIPKNSLSFTDEQL